MVRLTELVRLGHFYSSGSLSNPIYAFAGGSAVQCWLYDSICDREHHDIDLFAFNANFLELCPGFNLRLPLIIGGLEQGGLVAYSPTAAIQVQIVKGVYYDSEIIPTIADVRMMIINETPLLVLSPEFISVSKLSYPNVHHSSDFQDVLSLNQHGVLQNTEYLSALLTQTSIGKLISVSDILKLKSQGDLQALVDSLHRQLIRRFLRWDRVHVDALAPLQFFVLLDVGDELFNVYPETLKFIDTILSRTSLHGRSLEIAKLGLHFLTMGIPEQYREVMQEANFQTMIHRGFAMIPKHSTPWLSRAKITLLTLQHLAYIEHLVDFQFAPIWNSDTLFRIMQRILFDDPSRFPLFMLIKSVYQDLKAGRDLISNCDEFLNLLETPASQFLITKLDRV